MIARIVAALIAAAIVVLGFWIAGIDFERGVMSGVGFVMAWLTGIGTFFAVGGVK